MTDATREFTLPIPELIPGGAALDDRGEVSFVNAFNFVGVKRFYWIRNHKQGHVRAWHAHKNETKYFVAVSGSALIGAVNVDDWDRPAKDAKVWRFTLSGHRPAILHVPAGYANGFMNFTSDTVLMVFSTSSLEESQKDDFRYDSRYWDIWNITER